MERIEYDPNRSAHVALLKYEDGVMSYILAPNKINIGDEIVSGRNKEIKVGNCMQLYPIFPWAQIYITLNCLQMEEVS